MRVFNVRIRNITVDCNNLQLTAQMTFESQNGNNTWKFELTNSKDDQRLVKLMNFTNVLKVKDMEEKIIRAVEYDRVICWLGDPIEDKFIPLQGEVKEVTEAELTELLKK